MTEFLSNVGDAAQATWLAEVAEHNKRLAVLAKERKLQVDDVFGKNRLRDDLKGWLVDWLQRNPDAGDWGDDNRIVDAMLPLVIEIYGQQYGSGRVVEGGVDWLRNKMDLLDQYFEEGDYLGAHSCLTSGEAPRSLFFQNVI